jgi:hypothetical protein
VPLVTALAAILLFALLGVFVFHVRQRTLQQSREEESRRRSEWLHEQLTGLKSGQQSDIYFYCTSDTDELLGHFRDMPEVEELTFELTDVTRQGLKVVRSLPNLRHLVLYGGSPSVDDVGFGELRGHPTLEKLELVNTNVTDGGLAVLATLPNLKHLTLFRDDFRATTLTDNAVTQLRGMKQLEELEVSGGWISQESVQELRKALPNCTINTKGDWG